MQKEENMFRVPLCWMCVHCKIHYLILHSLICRVLLLLLLLRNASDLRNCTSYVVACMWVWYCRPPMGAHFHPTPQPPPVPQQLGEKAHLRTVAAVLANATATTLIYPSVQGPTPARGSAPARGPASAPARLHGFMTDAAGREPHRPSSRHWRRRLVQATAVRAVALVLYLLI